MENRTGSEILSKTIKSKHQEKIEYYRENDAACGFVFFEAKEQEEQAEVGKKHTDSNDFQVYFEEKRLFDKFGHRQMPEKEQVKKYNDQKGGKYPDTQSEKEIVFHVIDFNDKVK